MVNTNRRKTMKKLLTIIMASMFLTACSISEPRLSIVKKCTLKDDKVVYSYIWLYDKQVGLPADKQACKEIAND